jgi:hypothetical protein
MKNKRLLREYNELATVELANYPNLQAAFRFGCFKDSDTITDKNGPKSVYRKATKPENAANPHVYFYEDGRKEFRDSTGQVKRETTWFCQETARKTDPSATNIGEDAIGQLTDIYKYKLWSQVSGAQTANYQLVNLKDTKNLPQNLQVYPYVDQFNKQDFFMWKPVGLRQKQDDANEQGQKCLDFWTGQGYKDGNIPQTGAIEIIDMAKKCPQGGFQGEYKLWRTIEGIGAGQIESKLKEWSESTEKSTDTKSWCRNGITLYYQAYSKKIQIGPEQITLYRNAIADCLNQGFNYPLLKKEIDQLKYAPKIKLPTGQEMRYGIYDTKAESIERKLKGVIRESLIEVQNKKRKNLIQEQKIVKNRFKFLVENTDLRTRKGQKLLARQLFVETAYLHTQGFDKKIINEGFFDILGSLFGSSMDGALQYFKEYAVKWLLDQFGVDSSGWIGSIVVTAVGNLDLADIPKLTDCNFVTKLLSKSLAEGAVRKLQGDTVGLGPLQDIIRNTIVEVLSDTDLGQKIEGALGQFICPMISKIAGKLGMATDQLKTNALGTDSKEPGMLDQLKNKYMDKFKSFSPDAQNKAINTLVSRGDSGGKSADELRGLVGL